MRPIPLSVLEVVIQDNDEFLSFTTAFLGLRSTKIMAEFLNNAHWGAKGTPRSNHVSNFRLIAWR